VSQGIWLSVFHSVSAFCNAGFDLIGNFQSLTPFVNDPVVTLTVAALIILGGLGFVVIFELMEKKATRKLSLHTKIALTMTAALLISGFFHSVTPRTAGFNTLAVDQLMMGTLIMTMVFMFIGAGSAGTAGGVKVTTVGVVIASIVSTLKGRKETEVFQRRLPRDLVSKSIAILGLAFLLILTVAFILSITEDATFVEVLFETVSAFGTVGLSMGITTELSVVGKVVITLMMFTGRIGPLTLFMALAERRQVTAAIAYPDEEIMIG
jgi:trk system potassium uptake protein TrkH